MKFENKIISSYHIFSRVGPHNYFFELDNCILWLILHHHLYVTVCSKVHIKMIHLISPLPLSIKQDKKWSNTFYQNIYIHRPQFNCGNIIKTLNTCYFLTNFLGIKAPVCVVYIHRSYLSFNRCSGEITSTWGGIIQIRCKMVYNIIIIIQP